MSEHIGVIVSRLVKIEYDIVDEAGLVVDRLQNRYDMLLMLVCKLVACQVMYEAKSSLHDRQLLPGLVVP